VCETADHRHDGLYAATAIRLAPLWLLLGVFLSACLGLGRRLDGLSWANVGWVAYGVGATLGLPAFVLGLVIAVLDWFRPDWRIAWGTILFVFVLIAAGLGLVLGVALDF
jgi:hypothetical protein